MFSNATRVLRHLLLGQQSSDLASIQVVSIESGENVHVIVPDVLVACRFVVLACRCPIAAICLLKSNGTASRGAVDSRTKMIRKHVQVLVVVQRHHDQGAAVVRPEARRDDCERRVRPLDDVSLVAEIGVSPCAKRAKRALVPSWFMLGEFAHRTHCALDERTGTCGDSTGKPLPLKGSMPQGCWNGGAPGFPQ